MKMETATKDRIVRNAFLSLFIYLLPIVLMFITFYITGERPWDKKHQPKTQTTKSVNNNKKPVNNGSGD